MIDGTPLPTQFDAGIALGQSERFFRILDAERFALPSSRIGVTLESIGLAPITVDVVVIVYMIMNRGVSSDTPGI